jgi:hypothetical protein
MRVKVFGLAILVIATLFIPMSGVLADTVFWTGTSQTSVVEPLQVLGSAQGTPLNDQYVLQPTSINRGDTFLKSLWVKNTSTTTDYTVTPLFACSDNTSVTCSGLSAKPVIKGATIQFDFLLTGVKVGTPYTVTLSFQHN